jgi:uncharacterized membrane protein
MIDRPKQPHNKWKIFFAISFALNIALLSAIGGATFQYAKSQSSYDTKFKKPQIGSVYLRALNQNQRRELRREMSNQDNIGNVNRAKMKVNFNETIDILRSKDFDIGDFTIIVKSHADKSRQRLETGQEIFLSLIASMSFEERLAYADRIAKNQKGAKK